MVRVMALMVVALVVAACNVGRPALEFEPAQLPAAQAGQPYFATITVNRNETPVGDMFVADGSLPPGLTLTFEGRGTSDSGHISGTPTTPGSYTFKVGAWCLGTNVSGQSGEQSYTLVVS